MNSPRNLAGAPDETLVTQAELAELFGWAPATLRRRERQGQVPPRTAVPGLPRYRLADVRAWLAARSTRAA